MKNILFLDSNDGIQNYDNSASEYNNYHSYNLYFPLSIPLLNVKSISLKSIELPINLPNVRKFTGKSELSFSFIKDGATTSFTYWVNSGYYTTMNDFIPAVRGGFTSVNIAVGGPRPNIVLSTTTNSLGYTVAYITHSCTSMTFKNTILNRVLLGLQTDTPLSSPITGLYPINLNPDTHFYMHLSNIPTYNINNKQATFKIPLLDKNLDNSKLFYNEKDENQTNYEINKDIDKISIIMYDQFGFPLIGYNNWAVEFLIEDNE